MSTRLTESEANLIVSHNDRLLAGVEKIIDKLNAVSDETSVAYVKKQLTYYRNAASVLKWSSGIAKQRMGKANA